MIPIVLIAVLITGCARDESISKFADTRAEYVLVELDGAPFPAATTISFPEQGRVVGQGPCNQYFATQTVPYPWFGIEDIGSTRMACPDLALETAYFEALKGMTLAEVSGATLILSNSVGRQMVFVAR